MSNPEQDTPEQDECVVCGVSYPHHHTDLTWDETWGLVPGPQDEVVRD